MEKISNKHKSSHDGIENRPSNGFDAKLDTLPAARKEMITSLMSALTGDLADYFRDKDADIEILNDLKGLVDGIGNALRYVKSSPSSRGRQEDLRSLLVGASVAIDVSREARFDFNDEQKLLLPRFLRLIDERIKHGIKANEFPDR